MFCHKQNSAKLVVHIQRAGYGLPMARGKLISAKSFSCISSNCILEIKNLISATILQWCKVLSRIPDFIKPKGHRFYWWTFTVTKGSVCKLLSHKDYFLEHCDFSWYPLTMLQYLCGSSYSKTLFPLESGAVGYYLYVLRSKNPAWISVSPPPSNHHTHDKLTW